MKKFLIFSLILTVLILPVFALAQISQAVPANEPAPLVPCGNNKDPITGELTSPCNFKDLIQLIWNVITYLVFYLAVPFAALSIFWGGVQLLTFPNIPAKKDSAKKIIRTALIGIALALSAQLIVSAILNFFIEPGSREEILEPIQSYLGTEVAYAVTTGNSIDDRTPFQILNFTTIREFVIGLLDLLVEIGSPLIVLAVIYVGYLFVKARGNTSKIEEAKQAAQYTAIGIAIILGSYFLIQILDATIKNLTKDPNRSSVIINHKNS